MPTYLHRVHHLHSPHPLNWRNSLDQWNTPQKIMGRAVEPLHYKKKSSIQGIAQFGIKCKYDLTINHNTGKDYRVKIICSSIDSLTLKTCSKTQKEKKT